MRVLVFSAKCPAPALSGDTHRTMSMLRSLSRLRCSTTLATMESPSPEGRAELEALGVEAIHTRSYSFLDHKARGLYVRATRLGALAHPPAKGYFVTRGMQTWFARLARDVQPDIVFVIDSRFGDVISRIEPGPRRVIDTIDLESVNRILWNTVSDLLPTTPVPPHDIPDALVAIERFRGMRLDVDEAELARLGLYDDVLVIADAEVRSLAESGLRTQLHWIPMAFDPVELENTYSGQAVFVTGSHPFNVQGYMLFVREVLPLVRQRLKEFELRVVGSCSDAIQSTPGLDPVGFVPNLDVVYRDAAFAICPIFTGTGQQIKIVEAMARGLSVVAFADAASRSPIRDGVNGLVAHSPKQFADHIVALASSAELRRRLGERARDTIREECDIARQADQLDAIIRHAVVRA